MARSVRLRRLALIPDCHIPYHDVRAWRLVLKVLRAWRPDILVVLGDFIDCAMVSSHSKDPSRLLRFPDELRVAAGCLDELDALDASTKHFILGNHEHRLSRYIQDHARELCGLPGLTIPEILDLEPRGWQVTPYKSSLKLGHLYCTHDTGRSGWQAAKIARDTFEGNVVLGHVHGMNVHYSGNARGKSRVGMTVGWLGSFEKVEYIHKITALRSWQHGFGLGYMLPDGVVHLQPVPIIDQACIVEGKLFR